MRKEGEQIEVMSEEAISKALEAAKARVAHAEHERARLDHAIAAAREEQRLLEQLLALRQGSAAGLRDGSTGREEISPELGETRYPAVQAVIEELTASGRPLHISELMRLLHDRKVSIPGSGAQANLITHLRRDHRLVRPSRGMYGLSAWGLENMPTTRRKRQRRKRLRSTAKKGRTDT